MSMLQAFERLLNPRREEKENREATAERDAHNAEAASGPAARCKACGYTGDELYCPNCLADTMQRTPRAHKQSRVVARARNRHR
jgi:hypothetical protein